jgi:membrane protein implicated in regulation of membrane protease activity
MLWVYLAALLLGAGMIVVQLALGAHGGDVHDADASDVHHADAEAAWAIVLSMRFWTFALLAFGMVGALLSLFRLAGGVATPIIAVGSGVLAGLAAGLTFRALRRSEATSGTSLGDAVGQLGRVLLPCDLRRVGKVRVQLKGQAVDMLATADEEVAIGTRVVVQEMRGEIAHVTTAPEELAP